LNGTSDIAWENEKGEDGKNLMESFPNVQFYDYCKSPFRALKFAKGGELPINYHLTFSSSESNQKWIDKMPNGIPIAMVFSTKKGEALPLEYGGRIVIDGDETDARFLDPIFKSGKGTIVGLRSKGSGKQDTSGFVIQLGGKE
jgi:hypothetical protein